eukprot:scaffold9584_cov98-Skeletonema_marinoi.AAC.1
MPTLTLKRIRISSPLLPKPSETPKTETATALQILQNDNLTALVYNDRAALVYRDTAATAAKILYEKLFPSVPSDSTPSQPMTSIIDTSDGTAGSMNSNERNTHPDRNQRSSSELVIKRRLCSAEGSTNVDVAQNEEIVHFNKLYVGFMFRRYDEVKQLAVAYDAIASLPFNTILISHSMHVFYWGLINFWIARKTMDVIEQITLLQAEQCFYLEDIESAKRYYDAAILSAKEHKFVHEEALTCELAGHFMLESGEGRAAFPYFSLAQKKYGEWGAYAKEESLE